MRVIHLQLLLLRERDTEQSQLNNIKMLAVILEYKIPSTAIYISFLQPPINEFYLHICIKPDKLSCVKRRFKTQTRKGLAFKITS
jgi:hypothetical protein